MAVSLPAHFHKPIKVVLFAICVLLAIHQILHAIPHSELGAYASWVDLVLDLLTTSYYLGAILVLYHVWISKRSVLKKVLLTGFLLVLFPFVFMMMFIILGKPFVYSSSDFQQGKL